MRLQSLVQINDVKVRSKWMSTTEKKNYDRQKNQQLVCSVILAVYRVNSFVSSFIGLKIQSFSELGKDFPMSSSKLV